MSSTSIPPGEGDPVPFSGVRVFSLPGGELGLTLFKDGMVIAQLAPTEREFSREPGFYDLNGNSVPDPALPKD